MASFIPFVNTLEDCRILSQIKYDYKNSPYIRVSLESIDNISNQLPGIPLWLDPAVDSYEHCLSKGNQEIAPYLQSIKNSHILADEALIKKPSANSVDEFVSSLLDNCTRYEPKWITIPQLPVVDSNDRNKINALLAKAAKKWKAKSNFAGSLIFPIIFTHYEQSRVKTKWKPRIDNALKWHKEAGSKYIWIVDSSLSDQLGTKNFRDRFATLIELHQYVKEKSSNTPIIAGPYWGLNLILWAKGLCKYPGICLGTAYQYYLSNGFKRKGKDRIAIPPLRRTIVLSPELKLWLTEVLNLLSKDDSAYRQLNELRGQYDTIFSTGSSRMQTAAFYNEWLACIEKAPPSSRSLTLYQDFSSAFVLGKQLPMLPRSGSSARKAERVAEYFMLNCL